MHPREAVNDKGRCRPQSASGIRFGDLLSFIGNLEVVQTGLEEVNPDAGESKSIFESKRPN